MMVTLILPRLQVFSYNKASVNLFNPFLENTEMFFDLPLEQLRQYLPEREEPPDFEAFWAQTLAESRRHPLQPHFQPYDAGLKKVTIEDVTFNGYGGQPIKGWFLFPAGERGPLPCIVSYVGYGGGRGLPHSHLLWPVAGYAELVMDTRGQGSSWAPGDTPDPEPDGGNPHYPGFMTRGVLSPHTYYYRRVFTDAVRAIETARTHPLVDPQRVVVTGGSQGGGITLAACALVPDVAGAMPDVPFLCHYRAATEITDAYPYQELARYCLIHRDKIHTVFQTLSYFDGVNFAARARCPALFSTGLMDEVCPPRTVFAAYNHFGGPKEIKVWTYNHHEGGDEYQDIEKLRFLQHLFA